MVCVNKKASFKYFVLSILAVFVFLVGLVIAAHNITTSAGGSGFSVNESVNSLFNVTVNNTDAGQDDNITQVKETLPSTASCVFVGGSNSTDSGAGIFSNTTTVLSWGNATGYVVNGSEIRYFWFNMSCATPGNYNITITTTNATSSYNSNLSLQVNDTTAPFNLTLISPTPSNNQNLSQNFIPVNVSVNDSDGSYAGNVSTIRVYLYNSSGLVNNTNITTNPGFVNFTSLANGVYYINATANDTAGNENSSGMETRTVTLDTTAPKWQTNSTNSTVAGTLIKHNINWTDETALAGYIFSFDNGTGTLVNDSFVSMTGVSNWSNVSKVVNSTVGSTIRWIVYANDSSNNWNVTSTFQYTTTDATSPNNITLISPTPNANSNLSQNFIPINVSASDNVAISTVRIYLYNSSGLVNNTNDTSSPYFVNITGLAEGIYYINATANDTAGNENLSGMETRTVTLDTTAPSLSFVSPTPAAGDFNISTSIPINISVTESVAVDTVRIYLYNSTGGLVNNTNDTSSPYYINVTGLAPGQYIINATANDTTGNTGSLSSRTVAISNSSFVFNGTTYNVNGTALANTSINMSVYEERQSGPTVIGYVNTLSNSSGLFSLTVPLLSSWMYKPVVTYTNSTTGAISLIGQSLPWFPYAEFSTISNVSFYLKEAGTINITAVNATGSPYNFQYFVKDTALGYTIDEEFNSYVTQKTVYVPKGRNYSIMLYPNQSMPINYDWNNFSSASSYNFSDNLSSYNLTTTTLNKRFNVTTGFIRVSGYAFNTSGACPGYNEFTVVPFLLEPGNMVWISNSAGTAMPSNMSAWVGSTDIHNLTSCFYNITLIGSPDASNYMLFATARNSTTNRTYGGFRNVSLTYDSSAQNINFTMYPLMSTDWGSANSNITMWNGATGDPINISSARKGFNLVNGSNSTISNMNAYIEVKVDYSNFNSSIFIFNTAISSSVGSFYLPLLNGTGIEEINVYTSNYAPRRIGKKTAVQIISNSNISMSAFNPGDIEGTNLSSSIYISLYKSNSTCDVPSPPSSCTLGSSANMDDFNPLSSIIGGGKLSFRMGLTASGIEVHYVNVDMLASGPPDALFDDSASEATSGNFETALRFGSSGPTIYDYVLVSMPYTEGSSSTTGLNESADVNMSIPLLYDENWNLLWNSSVNGTNGTLLAGNYSHYNTYSSQWQTLMGNNSCVTNVSLFNSTNPCYINTTSNRIWIRLPHFSGTRPSITGSVITATPASSSSSSSGGGSGSSSVSFWKNTYTEDDKELSVKGEVLKSLGVKTRVKLKINNEAHYVGVSEITASTVTINVSSEPQIATLSIGDVRRFEVTGDGYYDLSVKLNSIDSVKKQASISILSIHESVTPETIAEEQKKDSLFNDEVSTSPEIKEENNLKKIILGVSIFIVMIILVIAVFVNKKRFR